MLQIKPLQSKTEHEAACARCATTYAATAMAYAATAQDRILALAQFKVKDETGLLLSLSTAAPTNTELPFLLGVATLNFMSLCGVRTVTAPATAAPAPTLTALGFSPDENGNLPRALP